jgi:hypothetical protein
VGPPVARPRLERPVRGGTTGDLSRYASIRPMPQLVAEL